MIGTGASQGRAPWRHEKLFRFIALVIGLLVGFALAELLARIWALDHPPAGHTFIRSRFLNVDLYPENPRGSFTDVRDHSTLPFALRERIAAGVGRGHIYGVEYRLNAAGFRERDFDTLQPGGRRIIFLGDSFTYGEGVPEKDVYPRVFERLLHESEGDGTEVVNLGMYGFNVREIAATLEAYALPLAPEAVYYAFVLNDLVRPPGFPRELPAADALMHYEPEASGSSAFLNLITYAVRRRKITNATIAWYQGMYASESPGFLQAMETIRNMHQTCAQRGIDFRMVIFPLFYSLDSKYPFQGAHRRILRYCEDHGIPCLDLLPSFFGHKDRNLWVTSSNLHPNEYAHRIAAKAIFDWRKATEPKTNRLAPLGVRTTIEQ